MMGYYPTPFTFTVQPGLPLLVMSCSEGKRATEPGELVRFGDLYNGPMWLQVRSSKYPMTNVAAISALYGFLDPGMAIETYDRVMDEKTSQAFCQTSDHVYRMAQAIITAGAGFVVGGKLYRELGEQVLRSYPDLAGLITFAEGSYLQQRKQLGEWLRANGGNDGNQGSL